MVSLNWSFSVFCDSVVGLFFIYFAKTLLVYVLMCCFSAVLRHFSLCNYTSSEQEKSSSSVKLPNIEKKSSGGDDQPREKFHATNWKSLSKKEIQKLPPQQRSKYLAVRDRSFSYHYFCFVLFFCYLTIELLKICDE